jgi:hypothetical protein
MEKPRSKYRGVNWFTVRRNGHIQFTAWEARIQYQGKRWRVGLFRTEEEAAKAYDQEASRVMGEAAKLNFR